MKKLALYSLLFTSLAFSFASCDYVTNVNDTGTLKAIGDKKVLIEDFTGHKCGNCPAAAEELRRIDSIYEGKIIPVAIHAGGFANISTSYPTDFRTTDGDAYDTQFGISAAGNPNGLINRSGYPQGSSVYIKAWSLWNTAAAIQMAQQAKFSVRIKNTFNSSNNSVTSDITVKSKFANVGNYKLVVLLTEDSIVAEQLDYRIQSPPAPSQKIPDYVFNHVLRGAVNSTWGDVVFPTGAAINDSVVKTYNHVINSTYRAHKCHIVAYVYDADPASSTYYEVLQAEQEKVK